MQLVYVNPGNSSVMEAQVLSLLTFYDEMHLLEKVTLMQGYKNKQERKALEKKLQSFNLAVVWFKTYPRYTFFEILANFSFYRVLKAFTRQETVVFHVRGEMYGAKVHRYLVNKGLSQGVLSDLRGVSLEEVDEFSSSHSFLKNDKIRLVKKCYNVLRKGANITVVSDAFRDYLVNQHGFQLGRIVVHPNIAGKQFTYSREQRSIIRKELNIPDDKLVAICSTGGGAAWQKDSEVIQRLSDLGVQVINLSPTKVDIPDVITTKVPFSQIPAYLSASDMAVLWRNKSSVNEVASPSKFSEFACMGLWVIHNDTVRIASDFIRKYNAGLLVEEVEKITLHDLTHFDETHRLERAEKGREAFGSGNIALSYFDTYKKIAVPSPLKKKE